MGNVENAVKAEMDKYQEMTEETAVYPKEHGGHYLALGLCDEVAELLEKVKQSDGKITHQGRVIGEAGDVLWYAARLCAHHGFSLGDMIVGVMAHEYTGLADLRSVMDNVVLAAGRIAGCAKKKLRDGTDKRGVVHQGIVDVLQGINLVSKAFGCNILVTAMQNQDKLFGRKERGTLQGSGDDR